MAELTQIELRASEYEARSPVELAYRVRWASSDDPIVPATRTVRGRYVAFVGGQIVVEVGGRDLRVDADRVRYLSPVNEEAHAASFRHGDRVRITKYGGRYVASVEKALKTRLAVVFETRGGKLKHQRIPAIECERLDAAGSVVR